MHPERRRWERYRAALDIAVDRENSVSSDVGAGGVAFETARRLTPSQHISIVIPFDHAAPGTRAECACRVLRVEPCPSGFRVAAVYDGITLHVK